MKKIFVTLSIILLCIFLGTAWKVKAGTENGRGWLWGGSESTQDNTRNGNETGLGWISLNSVDCDTNNDGIINRLAGDTGVPTGCPPDGTSTGNYGVTVPNSNGNLTGYGWSENVGWINFQNLVCPNDPVQFPVGTNCQARREGNTLRGFARIESIANAGSNSGGWEGFIDLSGVTIKASNDGLEGYGWNGESYDPATGIYRGLGAIDFSGASIAAISVLQICPSSWTLTSGSNYTFEARYGTGSDVCSTGTNYASSSSWNSSDTNIATSDGGGKFTAKDVSSSQTVQIQATYNSTTASAQLTVNPIVCVPNCSESNNYCSDEKFPDSCGTPDTCPGTRDCAWKEVTP